MSGFQIFINSRRKSLKTLKGGCSSDDKAQKEASNRLSKQEDTLIWSQMSLDKMGKRQEI